MAISGQLSAASIYRNKSQSRKPVIKMIFKTIDYIQKGVSLMERKDGRRNNELRPVKIIRNYTRYAEGSVLIEMGDTKVICNASVEEKMPPFIEEEGGGRGWVTAEYSMLPRATQTRSRRGGSGRGKEIQRLIGRSLRAIIDLKALGERTIILDCDVIQADAGTRAASITGGFIALADAIKHLIITGRGAEGAIRNYIAAISVGFMDGEGLVDLNYDEDCSVDVDFNLAMTSAGEIAEIQGTAEGHPLKEEGLQKVLSLGKEGIFNLIQIQKELLKDDASKYPLFAESPLIEKFKKERESREAIAAQEEKIFKRL